MWPFSNKDPQRFTSRRFGKILRNAVKHLDESPKHEFFPEHQIVGNGVYAIYFDGDFDLYDWLSDYNYCDPIYVGKAVPSGWRSARKEKSPKTNLQKRIEEHRKSLEQANNLATFGFSYKYVILDGDLIASVEAEAIRTFQPLWNKAIEGFGTHNVGRNRLGQIKSEWDVLHPGRPWADQMCGLPQAEVVNKIRAKLFGRPE